MKDALGKTYREFLEAAADEFDPGKIIAEPDPWKDEGTLRELYWDEEMTTTEIGEELGCAQTTIVYWLDKFDIHRRDSSKAATLRERDSRD